MFITDNGKTENLTAMEKSLILIKIIIMKDISKMVCLHIMVFFSHTIFSIKANSNLAWPKGKENTCKALKR